MEINHPDKILTTFFPWIWHKSPYLRDLDILIPDTIIIDDEPVEWYFTNLQKKIRKKMRDKLTVQNILKTFVKKTKGCEIAAIFITSKGSKTETATTAAEIEDKKKKLSKANKTVHENSPKLKLYVDESDLPLSEQKATIEYFTRLQLSKNMINIKRNFLCHYHVQNK